MRILADASLQRASVAALQVAGHDVVWVLTDSPRMKDEDILARAGIEGRLLIAADKDFGELVFGRRLPAPNGVVLLRARGSADTRASALVRAVDSREDWSGLFLLVENDDTRIRRVPSADDEPG